MKTLVNIDKILVIISIIAGFYMTITTRIDSSILFFCLAVLLEGFVIEEQTRGNNK
jgi:hypothetical protein